MRDNRINYQTQRELYEELLPVLQAKERINKYYGYEVTGEIMWNYLGKNKWRNDKNLSLAEIVNDIMILDVVSVKRRMINNE